MSGVKISVCFPIFNEENYIDSLLKSVIHSPPLEKEILVIEGRSTDKTGEKLKQWTRKHPNIKWIDNPERFVSPGFNKAFKASQAPYISLMGAHAEYPKNFFEHALEILETEDCDAVGGPLIQKGKTWKGQLIADCMSTKWGVGGTEFRTSTKKRYVQSVAFAVYDKKIFDTVGVLDEQLVRNQDDEFHYRLNNAGFKILMVPELACTYYVREKLKPLWKQYWGYGYYKPLVLQKVGGSVRPRHVIPALFALYWILSPLLCAWSAIFILPGLLYLLLNLLFSFKVAKFSIKKLGYAFLVYPTLHFAYGLGFLKGLINKPK